MLFSLCGIAQGIAAANAGEATIGITPSAAQRAAREILILGEIAEQPWLANRHGMAAS